MSDISEIERLRRITNAQADLVLRAAEPRRAAE
jgi:hypothetical protein